MRMIVAPIIVGMVVISTVSVWMTVTSASSVGMAMMDSIQFIAQTAM